MSVYLPKFSYQYTGFSKFTSFQMATLLSQRLKCAVNQGCPNHDPRDPRRLRLELMPPAVAFYLYLNTLMSKYYTHRYSLTSRNWGVPRTQSSIVILIHIRQTYSPQRLLFPRLKEDLRSNKFFNDGEVMATCRHF